jgi:hypothetical protein
MAAQIPIGATLAQADDQGTYLAARRRGRKRKRRQARIGTPDAALTASAGMAGRYAIARTLRIDDHGPG